MTGLLLETTTSSNDDVFQSVKDVFDSQYWILARNVALFLLAIFWLASAYWVYKDARRRIDDPWLLAMAVALGVFPPFVGPLLYLFFRPPEYLDDVHERELEIRAMEESLPHEERCPVCATKLRQACRRCGQPLEPRWQICPYCEAPVDLPRAVDAL